MSTFDDLHNSLMCSGTYMGDPALPANVQWVRQGRKYVLCTHDGHDTESSAALLSVVVKISDDGFWLTSDASWTQPTEAAPGLADIRGTCIGVRPTDARFTSDFDVVVTNLQQLQEIVATEGRGMRGFVASPQNTSTELKFRHVFFQPRDSSEDYAADDPIQTWPVQSSAAREALDEIVMTKAFAVSPLHAYDMTGKLIPPALYRPKLQGAMARFHFTLSHTSFKNFNNFTADIHSIRVLRSPSLPSSSPAKRLPSKTFDDPLLAMKGKRARK